MPVPDERPRDAPPSRSLSSPPPASRPATAAPADSLRKELFDLARLLAQRHDSRALHRYLALRRFRRR